MSTKDYRVNIGRIIEADELRRRTNRPLLSEIVFYKDGKPVNIPKAVIDWFELTGLSNTDFVTSGAWKLSEPPETAQGDEDSDTPP